MLESRAALARAQVDHFDGVVAQRRHKQLLAVEINVHVIDATSHVGQRDRLHKLERLAPLGERAAGMQ